MTHKFGTDGNVYKIIDTDSPLFDIEEDNVSTVQIFLYL